ncbi:MAG: aminotransferase class V-fold PLP-dependent enzyme [Acidimicrobiales bacterium]
MARHYLDHASTTPLRPEAGAAMAAWDDTGITADPGRVHTEGRMVRVALEEAREQVAGFFGVRPRQVVLTSGGTEAINAAVWGVLAVGAPGRHGAPAPVACAAVEHSAVRDASARHGAVVPIEVDGMGRIHPAAVEDALTGSVARHGRPPELVHCQAANHEVGTIHDLPAVVELCRRHGVPVHVDAVAVAGHSAWDAGSSGADLVSVSSHKLGGPVGVGALILRRGLLIEPFLVGGEQERGRRAGLENVRGAIGFGAAVQVLAGSGRLIDEAALARRHTDRLLATALEVDGVVPYGDTTGRVPHIVCFGVEGVEAEPVLLGLDQAGVAVHSGSSCSSESLEPSPVLQAMGVDGERSVRLSVGWSTTDEDVDAFAGAFAGVVGRLRQLAPS